MSDIWDPAFFDKSPLFEPIKSASIIHARSADWPSLKTLQKQFETDEIKILPVAQSKTISHFNDQYEPRIFLKGELQTRENNWHDFFNAMVWLTFSKTKFILNQMHYAAAKNRKTGTNRSPLENAIALFDECGAIIISDNEKLLNMIRLHQWKELFYAHRDYFNEHIKCIIFGHAMYEKALAPYIGMTCQSLLIHSNELMKTSINQNMNTTDQFIAGFWEQGNIQSTKDLTPFPVLGVPGWYSENRHESFYNDKNYFRPLSVAQ